MALAFKDTLANFFAGLYILADEPIRVGDYIKLEGGPEGYVQEVGWRSTRIRTLPNNIVVIPNSNSPKNGSFAERRDLTFGPVHNTQNCGRVIIGISLQKTLGTLIFH